MFSFRQSDRAIILRTMEGRPQAFETLVFRYQNDQNYYVVRANALEGNVVAYLTRDGKRSNLGVKDRGDAYGDNVVVPHRRWTSLRIIARDSRIEIFLDQRKLFEVVDHTLPGAGRIGLWTKADSITQFDDLRVAPLIPTDQPPIAPRAPSLD